MLMCFLSFSYLKEVFVNLLQNIKEQRTCKKGKQINTNSGLSSFKLKTNKQTSAIYLRPSLCWPARKQYLTKV